MELTDYEKMQALKSKVIELSRDDNNYFIKENDSLTEVIAEALCSLLGINCAHYIPLMINDTYYVASPDLNNDGQFILASTFLSESDNNIPDIINYFTHNFPNYKSLITDILKVFIFDSLFLNSDRFTANWGLLNNRVVILDNAKIFSNDSFSLMGGTQGLNDISTNLRIIFAIAPESILILEDFLKITPEVFSDLLSTIEANLHVKINKKKSYKYIYKKHYEYLTELLKNYRGEKKNAR